MKEPEGWAFPAMKGSRGVALLLAAEFTRVTGVPGTYQPMVPAGIQNSTTTTATPWDSSAASSLSAQSSSLSKSSGSSLKTASLKWSAPMSASLNKGSSTSDVSSSVDNFGSKASGSSGSILQLWQWTSLVIFCCSCVSGSFICCAMQRKPKKPVRGKKRIETQERPPEEASPLAPEPEQEFLPAVPPLTPMVSAVPVSSFSMPMDYGMYPATASYTAPLMAPTYAGQAPTYAGFAGAGYGMVGAAPAYAAAPAYSYQGAVSYPASPGSVV